MDERIREMKNELRTVDERLVQMAAEPEDGDTAAWDMLVAKHDDLQQKINRAEERSKIEQRWEAEGGQTHDGIPAVHQPRRTGTATTDYQAAALRALEAGGGALDPGSVDRCESLIRSGDDWFGRYFEVHARPEYNSAFGKVTMLGEAAASIQMSDAERQAMYDSWQVRAQAEGLTTAGGFAVPVWLDPTVILSNQESNNPFLQLCRVEDITTNVWKGISAAGVTWSFDTEAAEVSDDSITLAQPSVTVYMARGFIPYSIEVSQDWPGFATEMARLLAAGYDELILDKFTRGSGTNEPRGIITALDANTNVEVTPTTDGAFGQEDIGKVFGQLPHKFRRKAAWMTGASTIDRIRQFGTQAGGYMSQTVTLAEGSVGVLYSRQVFENPYFPDTTTLTTGALNLLVVGDFSNYVIARRVGLTVETVPHLFGASGRPTGQRGMFAFARIGGNSVLDNAFRLLQNV